MAKNTKKSFAENAEAVLQNSFGGSQIITLKPSMLKLEKNVRHRSRWENEDYNPEDIANYSEESIERMRESMQNNLDNGQSLCSTPIQVWMNPAGEYIVQMGNTRAITAKTFFPDVEERMILLDNELSYEAKIQENLVRKDQDIFDAVLVAVEQGWSNRSIAANLGLKQSDVHPYIVAAKAPQFVRTAIAKGRISVGMYCFLVEQCNNNIYNAISEYIQSDVDEHGDEKIKITDEASLSEAVEDAMSNAFNYRYEQYCSEWMNCNKFMASVGHLFSDQEIQEAFCSYGTGFEKKWYVIHREKACQLVDQAIQKLMIKATGRKDAASLNAHAWVMEKAEYINNKTFKAANGYDDDDTKEFVTYTESDFLNKQKPYILLYRGEIEIVALKQVLVKIAENERQVAERKKKDVPEKMAKAVGAAIKDKINSGEIAMNEEQLLAALHQIRYSRYDSALHYLKTMVASDLSWQSILVLEKVFGKDMIAQIAEEQQEKVEKVYREKKSKADNRISKIAESIARIIIYEEKKAAYKDKPAVHNCYLLRWSNIESVCDSTRSMMPGWKDEFEKIAKGFGVALKFSANDTMVYAIFEKYQQAIWAFIHKFKDDVRAALLMRAKVAAINCSHLFDEDLEAQIDMLLLNNSEPVGTLQEERLDKTPYEECVYENDDEILERVIDEATMLQMEAEDSNEYEDFGDEDQDEFENDYDNGQF